MAELADALDLGSSVHRRAGSSPVTRTIKIDNTLVLSIFIIPAIRGTGLEGDENDCCQWQMKGVRGRATTGSLRQCIYAQR